MEAALAVVAVDARLRVDRYFVSYCSLTRSRACTFEAVVVLWRPLEVEILNKDCVYVFEGKFLAV